MHNGEPNLRTAYVGIDPGASGCISKISHDGKDVEFYKMPDDPAVLFDLLQDICDENVGGVVVEKVGVRPYNSKRSCWTFGYTTGRLHACLEILGVKYTLVTPSAWMREMECLTGGDKNISKNRCIELFDGPITHWSADGILISEFSRRLFSGRLENAS